MSDEERVPPTKVRIGKLQEVQVQALMKLDRACAELYWELGFDAAEVPTRTEQDFYRLPKDHAVRVAEADYVVAGYTAYRDESPGVIYLEELSVAPEYQRFGIATKLLERVYEEARELGLEHVVLRTWEKAPFAAAFYAKQGFADVQGDAVPEKVSAWYAEHTEGGRPYLRPGERALFKVVPKPAAEEEDDD